MTIYENHQERLKALREKQYQESQILAEQLREEQSKCKHKFNKDLVQIGWIPDIEIMGYVCDLCGATKRK